jgi:hypothetical protein
VLEDRPRRRELPRREIVRRRARTSTHLEVLLEVPPQESTPSVPVLPGRWHRRLWHQDNVAYVPAVGTIINLHGLGRYRVAEVEVFYLGDYEIVQVWVTNTEEVT